MANRAALLATLSVLGALALSGDENLKPPAQVTTTQQIEFAPGGVIHINGSYGDLYVEGWDQAQVSITVTKFMPYDYHRSQPELSTRQLDAVSVVAQKNAPSELVILTHPRSLNFLRRTIPSPDKYPVRIEYQIHVPRKSQLLIHHGVGNVSITGVAGDIEAHCHRGDIVLWLPSDGVYSIDARNKFGKVSSDFGGASYGRFLVGQSFESPIPASAQKLRLRMGFGGITIKPIAASSVPR